MKKQMCLQLSKFSQVCLTFVSDSLSLISDCLLFLKVSLTYILIYILTYNQDWCPIVQDWYSTSGWCAIGDYFFYSFDCNAMLAPTIFCRFPKDTESKVNTAESVVSSTDKNLTTESFSSLNDIQNEPRFSLNNLASGIKQGVQTVAEDLPAAAVASGVASGVGTAIGSTPIHPLGKAGIVVASALGTFAVVKLGQSLSKSAKSLAELKAENPDVPSSPESFMSFVDWAWLESIFSSIIKSGSGTSLNLDQNSLVLSTTQLTQQKEYIEQTFVSFYLIVFAIWLQTIVFLARYVQPLIRSHIASYLSDTSQTLRYIDRIIAGINRFATFYQFIIYFWLYQSCFIIYAGLRCIQIVQFGY